MPAPIPPMSIEIDREYTTRDGREVKLYEVDCPGRWPVRGRVKSGNEWDSLVWLADGRKFIVRGDEHHLDLILRKVEAAKPLVCEIGDYLGDGVCEFADKHRQHCKIVVHPDGHVCIGVDGSKFVTLTERLQSGISAMLARTGSGGSLAMPAEGEQSKEWVWPAWLTAPWIAMDGNGKWFGYSKEPVDLCCTFAARVAVQLSDPTAVNFTPPPCTDWTKSKRQNPNTPARTASP